MKIGACIILYNPNIERLSLSIKELENIVDIIYLIDNNSSNIKEIEKEFKNNKIEFINNTKNCGIAYALNQALAISHKDKVDYLITLDQDSIFKQTEIEKILKHKNENNVAIFCPVINDLNKNKNINSIESISDIDRCITSGSIMNLKECLEVGLFDEKMFIDYVDFDYCKRIRLANKRIVRVNNSILDHEIGKRQKRKFLFWTVYPTNHNEKRIFYYSRNIKYYLKKYKKDLSISEKIKEYKYLIWKLVSIILYENNKNNKIKMYFKGIKNYKLI